VYVVAATNRPDVTDPAVLRPGRLDKPLFVDLPTPAERFEVMNTITRGAPLGPGVDLKILATDPRAENFSGADLNALTRETTTAALRRTMFDGVGELLRKPKEGGGDMQVWVGMEGVRESPPECEHRAKEKVQAAREQVHGAEEIVERGESFLSRVVYFFPLERNKYTPQGMRREEKKTLWITPSSSLHHPYKKIPVNANAPGQCM
jgi:SpoVK/Ycf46/Vps4 family AAA+-type ATPase